MARIIGIYEARIHWFEVIQDVRKSEHYLITHHGEPIAVLVTTQPQ
ncbi:type II toxin-antitoxin system Phd/YefM family antitoxin [Noviherbaspirillum pedocola]|uniref:Type II toxin-antitoxin system prevent-host-death family antitoxin n=1 Tax=Noviherbaspirillum pedocola TaxID=2801341 RepID=A0A934W7F6_9BURK|nr:type II toxin-antitoxin system prevent-host-death family antitoxin [Noviherbaspirillum pedocola]